MNLPNKTIGGKSVTIKRVPARDARHIQTLLMSLLAEPLSKALNQEMPKGKKQNPLKIIADGVGDLMAKLDAGDLDKLIELCQKFILIDGKPFDENEHFDATTLLDMYEVLWFFLKETFEGFITGVLSRLPELTTATSQK